MFALSDTHTGPSWSSTESYWTVCRRGSLFLFAYFAFSFGRTTIRFEFLTVSFSADCCTFSTGIFRRSQLCVSVVLSQLLKQGRCCKTRCQCRPTSSLLFSEVFRGRFPVHNDSSFTPGSKLRTLHVFIFLHTLAYSPLWLQCAVSSKGLGVSNFIRFYRIHMICMFIGSIFDQ